MLNYYANLMLNKFKYMYMENFLSNWFSKLITQKPAYLPLSVQNKELLTSDLLKCYTVSDIRLLREVLRLCSEDFSFEELVEFELNISYRLHLILYCENNFKNRIFNVHEFRNLLRNTKSYPICDAILLHVEIHQEQYKKVSTDYSIFQRIVTNRKTIIWETFKKMSA